MVVGQQRRLVGHDVAIAGDCLGMFHICIIALDLLLYIVEVLWWLVGTRQEGSGRGVNVLFILFFLFT